MTLSEFRDLIKRVIFHAGRWAEKITNGSHAAPVPNATGINTVPSRHRLYNAAGGILLWIASRYVMNIMVGETPGGKKIEKEKVMAPLRPLHGILAYNRYADDPHNQWMRVIDDLTPAIIGSVGAVLGSKYFFMASGREQNLCKAVKWGEKHHTLDAVLKDPAIPRMAKDNFVALQQARTWRVLSGISGVFSASSGMALLVAPVNILNYGVGLNNAFTLANGAVPGTNLFKNTPGLRWIYNTVANTSQAPAPAAEAIINNVSNCVAEMQGIEKLLENTQSATNLTDKILAENAGRIHEFAEAIVKKLFPNVTAENAKHFRATIDEAITKAVTEAKNNHSHTPKEIAEIVKAKLSAILAPTGKYENGQWSNGFDRTIDKLAEKYPEYGYQQTKYGNHGFAGWLGNHPIAAYGSVAAAAAGGLAGTALRGEQHHTAHKLVQNGKSHKEKEAHLQGSTPHPQKHSASLRFGRWLADSVINVPPQNRLFSAVGLSGGLWAGYRGMRALAGKDFNGAPLADNAKIDPVLKWFTNIVKRCGLKLDFQYFVRSNDNQIKRAIFWLAPTITGLIGVYWGSKFAFRKQYKELQNPEYLEDYSAKIALKQGDKWAWLSATAGSMASASGFSNLPIPGLNYSIGLSTRSVLSYDKKTTMPGMKWWSNNKSSYYFGLKGALDFTIRYAARNPSECPEELVPLADATLRPIFPHVTDRQIAQYVDKILEVRDKYMEFGKGIPKEKQAAAEKELHAILHGAGFEKTLEEIGLNPAKAVFDNGVAGSIANVMGAKKHVDRLSAEYRKKYEARRATQEKQPEEEPPPVPLEKEDAGYPRFADLHQPRKPQERAASPTASHKETVQLAAAEHAELAGAHGRI